MKRYRRFVVVAGALSTFFIQGVAFAQYSSRNGIEVRTMLSWNLPHPFDGPKNLTEEIFSYLMHPTVRYFAHTNNIEINYLNDGSRNLFVYGPYRQVETLERSLNQLRQYRRYQSDMVDFSAEGQNGGQQKILLFNAIRKPRDGRNVQKTRFENLPVLHPDWAERRILYSLAPNLHPHNMGRYAFPRKGTFASRDIKGELTFDSNIGSRSLHFLSYRSLPLGELRRKMNSRMAMLGDNAQAVSVYFDVPYDRVLEKQNKEWRVESSTSVSLKAMCPNYKNPKIGAIFGQIELRRILQECADLVLSGQFVGVSDSGLQRVHHENLFEFVTQRTLSAEEIHDRTGRLKQRWSSLLLKLARQPQEIGGAGVSITRSAQTGELVMMFDGKPATLRAWMADEINDNRFMDEYTRLVEDVTNIRVTASHSSDFIDKDRFRDLLTGAASLEPMHQMVIFDIPIPYHKHIEDYFLSPNFFGLEEKFAPRVFATINEILDGREVAQSIERFGSVFRSDVPCIILGQHPFYEYTRQSGPAELKQLSPGERVSGASTAINMAARLSKTADY